MNEYWEDCSVSFFVDVSLPYFRQSIGRYTAGFTHLHPIVHVSNPRETGYPDTTIFTFYYWVEAFEEADFEQWRAETGLATPIADFETALTIYKQHLVQMGYADPVLAFELVELETTRIRVTVSCQQRYILWRFVEMLGAICTDHESAKETVLDALHACLPAKQFDEAAWFVFGVHLAMPGDTVVPAQLGPGDTEPAGDVVPAQLGPGDTEPAGDVVPAQLGPGDTEPAGDVVPAQLGPGDTEPAGDVVPEIAKRKSKRGRSRSQFSEVERKQAVADWESIDRAVNPIRLEDWLEQRFGAEGGQLKVPKSTFHSWRKL